MGHGQQCNVTYRKPGRDLPGSIPVVSHFFIASNAMTRIQTNSCVSVQEPDAALSPLAIHFECVQFSVFC